MANVSFLPDNPEHFSASLVLFFFSSLYSAPGEHSIPSVLKVHELQHGGLLLGTHFRPMFSGFIYIWSQNYSLRHIILKFYLLTYSMEQSPS
jgi:hypothetical protein